MKDLVEATVQTIDGANFGVAFEARGGSNSNVRDLKAEIKQAEGASRDWQDLFMLVEGAEDVGAKSLCVG